MKRAIMYYALLSIMLLSAACTHKKVACVTIPKTAVCFASHNAGEVLSYTGYKMEAYSQGSDFATKDTAFAFDTTVTLAGKQIVIKHPYLQTHFDQHDWIFTFYPSNVQCSLKNVARVVRTETMVDVQIQEGVECYNGYSFLQNDVAKTSVNYNTSYRPEYEYVYVRY